ncbi:MAG: AraC family transcriptional regulator [Betaproteobacteria bacterium]|nr:MAG: AraC family transcriptional regulator [Betaproteobacteria bacterium]
MTYGPDVARCDATLVDDYDGQLVAPAAVIAEVLPEFGVDPAEVLDDAGLPPGALDDPRGRIPFASVGTILESSVRRTGCEHIGLICGERLGLARMGAVGELTRLAATVGDALATLSLHHHLNTSGAVAFVTVDGNSATFAAAVYRGDAAGMAVFADAVGRMTFNVMRELTHPAWRPDEVLLARSRPRSLVPYRRAFPAPIRFDAEYVGVRFSSEVLAWRVPTADPVRFAALDAHLATLGHHSLVNDLRRALRLELVRGHASASRVSQMLAMHRRTLHRRLADAGTSFQTVLDEVRFDVARHYLTATDMPLAAIAAALGYSELSAFNRAFRRWSGSSPGRLRGEPAKAAETQRPAA